MYHINATAGDNFNYLLCRVLCYVMCCVAGRFRTQYTGLERQDMGSKTALMLQIQTENAKKAEMELGLQTKNLGKHTSKDHIA